MLRHLLPWRLWAPALTAVAAVVGSLLVPAPAAAQGQPPRTIVLDNPAPGASVTSPVEVRGRVTIAPFENALVGRVYDGSGQLVGMGPVTVAPDVPGTLGGTGSFAGQLTFAGPIGAGRVEVADLSERDGSVLASASANVTLLGSGAPPPDAGGSGASWLDQDAPAGWNAAGAPVPAPPQEPSNDEPRCRLAERPAETPEDELVTRAGWRLFREYVGGWETKLVFGLSSYDGMCRPLAYQVFVFAKGTLAGTLSPQPMVNRADGAVQVQDVRLVLPTPDAPVQVLATYSRYGSDDPLCCPSGTTQVTFALQPSSAGSNTAAGPDALVPVRAEGTAAPAPAEATDTVTGTLIYRERIALPPEATATVTLADASRADVPAITIAEQTISPTGQVPIPFSLAFNPATISPRARYLVRGTITVGGTLLFTSTQAYPVITQGAPTDVEVLLQRV